MNKELIKKYKAEFDHWLNGGKLQAKLNLKISQIILKELENESSSTSSTNV